MQQAQGFDLASTFLAAHQVREAQERTRLLAAQRQAAERQSELERLLPEALADYSAGKPQTLQKIAPERYEELEKNRVETTRAKSQDAQTRALRTSQVVVSAIDTLSKKPELYPQIKQHLERLASAGTIDSVALPEQLPDPSTLGQIRQVQLSTQAMQDPKVTAAQAEAETKRSEWQLKAAEYTRQTAIATAQALHQAASQVKANPNSYGSVRASLLDLGAKKVIDLEGIELPEQAPPPAVIDQIAKSAEVQIGVLNKPEFSKDLIEAANAHGILNPFQAARDPRVLADLRTRWQAENSGKKGQGEGTATVLRKEFQNQQTYKDTQIMAAAWQKMQDASDTGTGDIGRVFLLMKLFDPNSTVREGEYATAANAGGVPAQIMNLYNRVRDGKRLPEGIPQEFMDEATRYYNAQLKRYDYMAGEYRRLAQKAGADPNDVVLELGGRPDHDPRKGQEKPTGLEHLSDDQLRQIAGVQQ